MEFWVSLHSLKRMDQCLDSGPSTPNSLTPNGPVALLERLRTLCNSLGIHGGGNGGPGLVHEQDLKLAIVFFMMPNLCL